jgi:hypothetical protein
LRAAAAQNAVNDHAFDVGSMTHSTRQDDQRVGDLPLRGA